MSSHNQAAVRKLSRVALVVELLVDNHERPEFFQVVTSLPHRPSTVTKTWLTTPTGHLASGTYTDLMAFVEEEIGIAVTLYGGVQGSLGV